MIIIYSKAQVVLDGGEFLQHVRGSAIVAKLALELAGHFAPRALCLDGSFRESNIIATDLGEKDIEENKLLLVLGGDDKNLSSEQIHARADAAVLHLSVAQECAVVLAGGVKLRLVDRVSKGDITEQHVGGLAQC